MRRTSARLDDLMAALAAVRGVLSRPSSRIPCGHRRRGGVDDPDADLARRSRLGDFADRLCTTSPLTGRANNVELSGNAKAALSGLIKQLANLGIGGAAEYQKSEWQGVLQQDLARELSHGRACRLEVYRGLKDKLLSREDPRPSGEDPRQPAPKPDKRPIIPREKAAALAVQLMRLLSTSGTSDDVIINKISVPFCAEEVLLTSNDLRRYLDSKSTNADSGDLGRVFVRTAEITILDRVRFDREYNPLTLMAINQCKYYRILSPLGYMVTLIVKLLDLRKSIVSKLIVDSRSRLIKWIFPFFA